LSVQTDAILPSSSFRVVDFCLDRGPESRWFRFQSRRRRGWDEERPVPCAGV